MKIFSALYDRVLGWSRHPHAPWYLGGLSFAESSFFPVPPDVMLAPMSLAQPQRAWRFALLTTVASSLGGVLGYLIGVFAFELVEPWLHQAGYWPAYLQVNEWFSTWGFWAIFLAGFSPIAKSAGKMIKPAIKAINVSKIATEIPDVTILSFLLI